MTEEKKKGFIAEFKEFINRGSVVDLAVGVVVGGAFTAIVNSLVNDIIMPAIGLLTGGIDFANLSVTVGDATLKYGNFIQNIINFFIVAFCIFLVVRVMNRMRENSSKSFANLAAKTAELKAKSDAKAAELKAKTDQKAAELKAKAEALKSKSKKS